MKKHFLVILAFTCFCIASVAYSAVGYTAKFVNPTIVGGTFKVDIYLLRTGTNAMRLGNANFWFTYNASALSTPTISAHGIFNNATNNDYDVATLTSGTFNALQYVSYNVLFNGAGDNGLGQNPVNTSNGSFVATIQFTVTNAAATTNLSWQSGGYAVTTDVGTSITSSGDWVAGNLSNQTLPVELVSFSAITKGRNVELAWKTATETNNAGFEVQRKQVGTEWTKVGYVDGNGTSAKEHNYTYTDAAKSANKYSYRLKQIDRDGKFQYSNEVEAVTALSAEDYKLSSNYPNPFNPSTKFNFAVKNAGQVSVKVFNGLGQDVATLFNEVAQPNQMYEMNFNAGNLASGTYFYVLRAQDRYEVKKMLLMK